MSLSHDQGLFFNFKRSALLFLVFAGICFGQSTWKLINANPTTDNLSSVTYGNSQFLAVGDNGRTLVSMDGSTWTVNNSGIDYDLHSVTYGDGQFVTVGNEMDDEGWYTMPVLGGSFSSTNGAAWINYTYLCSPYEIPYSVTYGNGLFVVVVEGGPIFTSPDGATWSSIASGTSNDLFSVTYGNGPSSGQAGQFIAVGDSGTILTSSDGTTWTIKSSGTTNCLSSVTYGADKMFIAVGDSGTILTSPDGTTWSLKYSGTTNELTSVTYGDNQFVAVGGQGTILTSSDGAAWSEKNSVKTKRLTSVTYGKGVFVAVGDTGTIIISKDGNAWSGITTDFISVIYGSNQFVAVGENGTIFTSSDDTTWTKKTSGTINALKSVTYGNNQFIAVGDSGTIVTSPDGTTWAKKTSGTINRLNSVTYGNNQFITVGGSGTILTSPNGNTWTAKISGTTSDLFSVTYGSGPQAGQFVAAGNNCTILTSADGTTWTIKNNNSNRNNLLGDSSDWVGYNNFSSVTYGNGKFVYARNYYQVWYGESGWVEVEINDCFFYSSPDGVNWTATDSSIGLYSPVVTYGNGQFLVAGDNGMISTSPDGSIWTARNSGTNWNLTSITYGNGQFVAVGDGGTILISKADNIGVTFHVSSKPDIHGLKINCANDHISATLPSEILHSQLKVGLFNVAGRRIYSATIGAHNGILNIPATGFPAGKYFISITDESKRTLNTSFVLTR